MNTVNIFLICGCSLQCLLGVKAAYNSLGDKYIFLVPPMLNTLSPRIILHLHSPTSPTVTVTDPGQQKISFTVEANVTRLQEFSQLNLQGIYRGVSKAFILTGDGLFSVTVQMAPSNLNLATFQALPVSEWGSKYMIVTTDLFPIVQLMAAEDDTDLMIYLKFTRSTSAFVFEYQNKTYRDQEVLRLVLNSNEGFTISNCDLVDTKNVGALTGTIVEGHKPFGTISGNCLGATKSIYCYGKPLGDFALRRQDAAVEMLLPTTMYGYNHIVFPLQGRISPARLVLMAHNGNTMIVASTEYADQYEHIYIKNAGDHFETAVTTYARSLKSNFAIQVVYFQSSPCRGESEAEEGSVAMAVIVPNELFYNSYRWRTAEVIPVISRHFASVVVKQGQLSAVKLGAYFLQSLLGRIHTLDVSGQDNYQVHTLDIDLGDHYSYSNTHKFGLYVYGLSLNSYMHIAGFTTRVPCIDDEKTMCELNDGQEINFDEYRHLVTRPKAVITTLITTTAPVTTTPIPESNDDETTETITVQSGWGLWMCTRDCSESRMVRIRTCDVNSLCPNRKYEYREGECHDPICPLDCPEGTWGQNCRGICNNCLNNCDKFNGTCLKCKAGYMNRQTSCTEECPAFRYGEDCSGDCMTKCSAECLDKTYGTCPGFSSYLYLLLLIVLVAPVPFYFFVRGPEDKQSKVVGVSEDQVSQSSRINVERVRTSESPKYSYSISGSTTII